MAFQETLFLNGEANAWYHRNKYKVREDEVLKELTALNITPKSVLEYGCSDGWRLGGLQNAFHNCVCWGVDPSRDALHEGRQKYPGLNLERGNASQGLPGSYDLVIYGFCLYVCDPSSLSKIVAIGDANVNNGGYLMIQDFDPDYPHKVPYHHDERLLSYKMDHSKLWLANPSYTLVQKTPLEYGTALWTLRKDVLAGWPEKRQ